MHSFLPLCILLLLPTTWARTCSYEWITGSAYAPCGPGDTVSVTPNASLATCFASCVDTSDCKSFRLNTRSECLTSSCRPSAKRRGRSAFGILRRCKETDSQSPSSSPSSSPLSSPDPLWTSPSGIPKSAKMNWSAFYVPDMSACETLRPSKMSKTISWTRWGGTLEDCGLECLFDSRCGGFVLDKGTCFKSSALQITDVLDMSDVNPDGFVKVGFIASYWSGICSTAETESECESFPSICGWRAGKRGINQMRIMDGGWCGRQCDSFK